MKITQIVPDENQPRRYFDQKKLKELEESIKKYGVINPVIVQKHTDGKYLLLDGERRWRASKNAGLKDIPVTEVKPKGEEDRLLYQLNVQDHHQSWTTLEKAYAMKKLSDVTGESIKKVCLQMGIDNKTADAYSAFIDLANPDVFRKHNISIFWANKMSQLTKHVKKLYEEELDKDFDLNMQKKFEEAVSKRVADGRIYAQGDLVKLKDAFKMNPKTIDKFIDKDSVSPQDLYRETNASTQRNYRNIITHSHWLISTVDNHLKDMDAGYQFHPISEYDANDLKRLAKKIDELVNRID